MPVLSQLFLHRTRNADSSGLCERFDARRDVHTIAVDATTLDRDVTEMHADAKPHVTILRQTQVACVQDTLDFDGCFDRIERRGKFGQHVVPGGVDDAPAVLADQAGDQAAIRCDRPYSCGLIVGHQTRISDRVRAQDRRQPAFENRRLHGSNV